MSVLHCSEAPGRANAPAWRFGHQRAPCPMEFWRLTGCSSASPCDLGESERERRPVKCGFRMAGCSAAGAPTGAGPALKGALSVLELLPA